MLTEKILYGNPTLIKALTGLPADVFWQLIAYLEAKLPEYEHQRHERPGRRRAVGAGRPYDQPLRYYSGKKKAFMLKTEFVTDGERHIRVVSEAVPGAMHDKKLSDGVKTPFKKPKGEELTEWWSAEMTTYRFDPVDLEQMRLLGRLSPGGRIWLMLDARELAVGPIRGRLRRRYPNLSSRITHHALSYYKRIRVPHAT